MNTDANSLLKGLKPKYKNIYQLALPYYKKGRELDDLHHLIVSSMAIHIAKELKLDENVLVTTALLHDIGYSQIPPHKRKSHWAKKVKRDHMKYGSALAKKILQKLNYPKIEIDRVANIISIHDNPELGLPIKSKEARAFKEADLLWMTTEEAFWLDVKRRPDLTPKDWLNILENRFSKDRTYTRYLKTSYGKKRVRDFLKRTSKIV